MDKKAEKLCFVGYSKETKGYRLFTQKIVTQRDVVFNEMDFGSSGVEAETETVKPNEVVEVGPNL